MTIGNCRFLYNNLVDTATLTAASVRDGYITSSLKYGTGSATMTSSGVYTGQSDLEYTVEIDSVAGGAEVGQATFRWKKSSSSGWDATGVPTASTATTLDNGATVKFTSGTGDDFVLGDTWYFKGINRFSPVKLHDYDRDTRYRTPSGTTTAQIVFDFGSAKSFDSLAVYDHNLSASATITFEANAADSWGAPSFSQSITYNADKVAQFFASQSYRYARLTIVNTGNTDGYIELGEVFIGAYMELSKTFDPGHSRDFIMDVSTEQTQYGVIRDRYRGKRRTFGAQFSHLVDADITKIEAMLDAIAVKSTEILQPIYFVPDSQNVTEFWLMRLAEFPDAVLYSISATRYHNVSMNMVEIAKSV